MRDGRRAPETTATSALSNHLSESREPWLIHSDPDLRSLTFAGLRAPADEFPVAVRLGSDGGVLESRGEVEELVELVAYSTQLAERIGELLGLQRFFALESPWQDGGRLVICAAPDGSTIALRSHPETNLAGIRYQLRLSGRG